MYSKIYSEAFIESSSYCDKLLYRYTSIRRDKSAFGKGMKDVRL